VNPFRSLLEYEAFLYALPEQYGSIVSSTLVVVRRSANQATIGGEIIFARGYRLVV
jgi:hypothetical protein